VFDYGYLCSENALPFEELIGAAVNDAQILLHVGLGDALLAQEQNVNLRAVAVDLLEERLDAHATLVQNLLVSLGLLVVLVGGALRVQVLVLELFQDALTLLFHLDALLLELSYVGFYLLNKQQHVRQNYQIFGVDKEVLFLFSIYLIDLLL
jgi:hypothetical protein